jgi:hypothetical protein
VITPVGSAKNRQQRPFAFELRGRGCAADAISAAARILAIDSASSVPPHIQPSIAQVPRATRETSSDVPGNAGVFHGKLAARVLRVERVDDPNLPKLPTQCSL